MLRAVADPELLAVRGITRPDPTGRVPRALRVSPGPEVTQVGRVMGVEVRRRPTETVSGERRTGLRCVTDTGRRTGLCRVPTTG